MTQPPLSRHAAERRAKGAQITCAVLGVGILAMATLALPRITAVPTLAEVKPAPVAPPTHGGSAEKPAEKVAVNSEGISDRFMQFANHPQSAAPVDETQAPQPEAESPPPPTDETRFLGVIRDSKGVVAMVHAGGKQRIMAEGEEAGGVKVISISPEAITVQESGVEKKIEKSARSGSSVTMVGGSGTPGSPVPMGRPEMMGRTVDQPEIQPPPIQADPRADAATNAIQQMKARRQKNLSGIPGVGGKSPRLTPGN